VREETGSDALPLDGLTVVALEQAVAAPLATRHLADWGARVIKVERPDGGDFARRYDATVHGMSSYFVWLNRGKESLTLDLKSEAGREVLARLLGRADVLVENLAPGAVERLGWPDEALRRTYPRLVTAHVSGYGRTGPYRDRKAYDLLVQCETGMVSLTGSAAEAAKVGTPVADIAAGMYAAMGTLLALRQRDATGQGGIVDVAMLDGLGEWLGHALYFTLYGGTQPRRAGLRHATIAPYGPYRAADGTGVFLAVQNEREWLRLCREVLERPDLAEDPDFVDNRARVAHGERLDRAIGEALARIDGAALRERLDRCGIARADMNGVADFARHPQLRARERWRPVDTPAGPVDALLPPVTLSGVEAAMAAVPALGEHTDTVLRELGLAADAIAALRAHGDV